MPHVQVGPGELYYQVRGEGGPRVLYLLGLGSFAVAPTPYRLEDVLAREAQVLLPDARGIARSTPAPDGNYTIAGFADDAAALLDHAGWDRVHVVGVSMGGLVAQAFARQYPERTATLALLATAAGFARGEGPSRETAALMQNRDELPGDEAARRAWATSYTEAFIAEHGEYLEWRREQQAPYPSDARTNQQHLVAAWRFDTSGWVGELGCPVLVAWGDADRIVPASNSRRLAALVRHAETLALPGLGHAFPTEARAEVATALRRLWARAAVATGVPTVR